MDWLQVMTLFFANAGLVIWFRSESRNDWHHMDSKVDAIREDSKNKIDAIRQEMKDFHSAMMQETKDFHGRLCAIEERNKEKK